MNPAPTTTKAKLVGKFFRGYRFYKGIKAVIARSRRFLGGRIEVVDLRSTMLDPLGQRTIKSGSKIAISGMFLIASSPEIPGSSQ